MSKAKFERAKELIREKEYGKARALLKTIDHPTAKDWIAKLDQKDELRYRRNWRRMRWILIALVIIMGVVALIIVPPYIQMNNEQTRSMSTAVANVSVAVALEGFCKRDMLRPEQECEEWANIVTTQDPDWRAKKCYDLYDSIRETDLFSLCLLNEGIRVLGDEPFAEPISTTLMSEVDVDVTSLLYNYCIETHEDDYCLTWALITFTEHPGEARLCNSQTQGLTDLYGCFEQRSLTP